ncbi:hypothetical protein KP509_03G012600 [Ceratopteris richardii]|uniref:Uncharacterized protein n=1 Tax=Ceratopteris richardii TaxID=49495 RepID=A0A8T2V403_CERRI|nr:hypothetical protein KP509_03G012600 [Ceratopteris richardii]
MHSESEVQARTFSADRMESLKNTSHFNIQHIRGGRYGRPFHKSADSAKFMSIQETEDEGEEERMEDWKQMYHSSSPSPSVSSSSSTSASFSSLTPPCSQTIGAEGTVSEGVSRLRRPPIYSTVTLLTIMVLLLLLPLVLPPLPPPPLELMLLPVLILAFLMSSALFHRGDQLSAACTSHLTCASNRLACLFDV